jgi:hypothetical protein
MKGKLASLPLFFSLLSFLHLGLNYFSGRERREPFAQVPPPNRKRAREQESEFGESEFGESEFGESEFGESKTCLLMQTLAFDSLRSPKERPYFVKSVSLDLLVFTLYEQFPRISRA